MKYEFNPNQWRKIFAVPSSVAEKYLKLASGNALKVLLFIAYKNDRCYSLHEISDELKISEENVEESIIFWKSVDVLCDDDISAPIAVTEEPAEAVTVRKTIVRDNSGKELNPAQIADRINSCEEVRFLFSGAENIFAHPLTHTEQRSLIWLHDYLGFSSDVILTLIDYCKESGKLSVGMIEAIARSWNEKGISSLSGAEEEIEQMREYSSFENKIKTIFGIKQRNLSTKEKAYVSEWCRFAYSSDLISYAYDKTVDSTGNRSFAYINKILLSWKEKGFVTKEDVDRNEDSEKASKNGTKSKKTYDFDKLAALSLNAGGKE